MLFPKITKKNITLRPFIEDDGKVFSVWDKEPLIQAYMPEPHVVLSEKGQQEYIEECGAAKDEFHAAIVVNEKCIGTVSVVDINEYHGAGELGLVIGDSDYWGKGYGTQAVNALLEYLNKNTGLRRIVAECEADNIGMRKVFERVGFELETICKQSRIKMGKPIDTVRYVYFL